MSTEALAQAKTAGRWAHTIGGKEESVETKKTIKSLIKNQRKRLFKGYKRPEKKK